MEKAVNSYGSFYLGLLSTRGWSLHLTQNIIDCIRENFSDNRYLEGQNFRGELKMRRVQENAFEKYYQRRVQQLSLPFIYSKVAQW